MSPVMLAFLLRMCTTSDVSFVTRDMLLFILSVKHLFWCILLPVNFNQQPVQVQYESWHVRENRAIWGNIRLGSIRLSTISMSNIRMSTIEWANFRWANTRCLGATGSDNGWSRVVLSSW